MPTDHRRTVLTPEQHLSLNRRQLLDSVWDPIPDVLCRDCHAAWKEWRWFRAPASWLMDNRGQDLEEKSAVCIKAQHKLILTLCTEGRCRARRGEGLHG